MNVPRAAGIQRRLDRAEIVLAAGAGEEPPKPLEVRVSPGMIVAAGVQIDPVVVNLPNLNQSIANGVALGVEDASAQVRDFSDRRRDAIVDNDQVIVRVEW